MICQYRHEGDIDMKNTTMRLVFCIAAVLAMMLFVCCHAETSEATTAEEKVAQLVAECEANGIYDPYDAAFWMHEWLTHNANYDYTFTEYGPEGVLLKGTGVCQSYAEAFRMFLDSIGVENMIVVSPEMDHAWNLVKLNDIWCHVDVTWDDPNEGGQECHTYFGISDDMMDNDHTWDKSAYPACPSNANSYAVNHGEYIEYTGDASLEAAIVNSLKMNATEIVFYDATDADFDEEVLYDKVTSIIESYGVEYKCAVDYLLKYNRAHRTLTVTVNYLDGDLPLPFETVTPREGVSFKFYDINGKAVSSANYKDKKIMLVFGNSGCYNTLNFLSAINARADALVEGGVEVVVVFNDDPDDAKLNELTEKFADFHVVRSEDDPYVFGEVLDRFGISSSIYYPVIALQNTKGYLSYFSTNFVSEPLRVLSTAVSLPAEGPEDVFTIVANGKGIAVSEYKGTSTVVTIPAEIGGKTVNAIYADTFAGNSAILSVNIPNTVESIGDNAFSDAIRIRKVIIPKGVTMLGKGVFKGCKQLKDVLLPESLTSIGDECFADCGFVSISIPDGVASISENAFADCANFTTAYVSEGSYAEEYFAENYPSVVVCYGDAPEKDNFDYVIQDGECMIIGPKNDPVNLVIPAEVNSYPVTAISAGAFANCLTLKKVVLPESMRIIGESAFFECLNLKNVDFNHGLEEIYSAAFYKCESLERVWLPDSLTVLGEYAFSECSSVKQVRLSYGLTELPKYVFLYNKALKHIRIPDSITKFAADCFFGCGLETIVIPASVTSIGEWEFYGCPLKTVYTTKGSYADKYIRNSGYYSGVSIKYDLNADIKNAAFVLPANTEVIDDEAFKGVAVKSIMLPESVKRIGAKAFSGCKALEWIFIPDSVTDIDATAFDGCKNVVIYCHKDSPAEAWAKRVGIDYDLR
ncbi:MAG: hypothetical protein E7337_13355 [Clostridiales bacterium]|nr:hypothetical protein [Clostridiales bacterium]